MNAIVKFKGGLGNQLFQYAFGKYLKKQGYKVAYNAGLYKKHKQRKPRLPYIINVEIPLTDQKPTHDDYWHDLKYTEPVRDEIISELNPAEEKDLIAIHVRRGDYVVHPKYVNLGFDYYDKAYNLVTQMFGPKKTLVFSDDPGWCRENIIYPDTEIIDEKDYVCFDMIRGCRYKVTANSTFSWWAAYASEGEVVTPEKWRLDDRQTAFVEAAIPKGWRRI